MVPATVEAAGLVFAATMGAVMAPPEWAAGATGTIVSVIVTATAGVAAFETPVITPAATIDIAINVTPPRTPGIPVPVPIPAQVVLPVFPPAGIVLAAPATAITSVIPAEPVARVLEPPAPSLSVAEGLVAVAESPASRVATVPVLAGEPGLTGVVATLMPVGAFHAARDLVAPGARLGVAHSPGCAGFVAAGCALGGGPALLRGSVRLVRLGFLLGHGHVRSSNVLVSGPADEVRGLWLVSSHKRSSQHKTAVGA
jgi:hypothetical protein